MSNEEEFVEYDEMHVPELKAECDARVPPVPYKSNDNKATIIAALEQWDEEHGEPEIVVEDHPSEDAPPDETPPPPPDEDAPKPTTFTYVVRPKSLSYLGEHTWEMANWKACASAAMAAGLNPVGDPRRVDVTQYPPEVVYEVDVA